MQKLLETYIESSNPSHISIESDKQPVSVTYSLWKDRPYSETASENFQTTSTNFQIMKSNLTEGISKAVQQMNLSRNEKIDKCYADTGVSRLGPQRSMTCMKKQCRSIIPYVLT